MICKFPISSHNIRIETERHKSKPVDKSLRICKFCTQNNIENEIHFLTKCPFYNSILSELYTLVASHCQNFKNLDDISKFLWLMTTQNPEKSLRNWVAFWS